MFRDLWECQKNLTRNPNKGVLSQRVQHGTRQSFVRKLIRVFTFGIFYFLFFFWRRKQHECWVTKSISLCVCLLLLTLHLLVSMIAVVSTKYLQLGKWRAQFTGPRSEKIFALCRVTRVECHFGSCSVTSFLDMSTIPVQFIPFVQSGSYASNVAIWVHLCAWAEFVQPPTLTGETYSKYRVVRNIHIERMELMPKKTSVRKSDSKKNLQCTENDGHCMMTFKCRISIPRHSMLSWSLPARKSIVITVQPVIKLCRGSFKCPFWAN